MLAKEIAMKKGQIKLDYDTGCDEYGKDYSEDIARISTFSYPAILPYNFSMGQLNINPNGVSAFDQCLNSFSLSINLNYVEDRFKICSDGKIKQPIFNAIPEVTFTANIDADKQFIQYAFRFRFDFILQSNLSGPLIKFKCLFLFRQLFSEYINRVY